MNNREKELDLNRPRRGRGGLFRAFQGIKGEKVTKICQECGEEFEAYDLGPFSRRYCNKCSAVKAAEEEQIRQDAERALAESQYRELVAMARIPKFWRDVTFENTDPSLQRAAYKIAQKYAESFTVESGTLVFYSRGYGRGKTRLAACIINHALHHLRRPVFFTKARDLLLEIRRTFSERGLESEVDILNRVLSVELLLLDDVGVDNPSPWIESTYWTIFDRRLEWQLPTLVTTNYPLEAEPGEVSLGERIGYGALSRLTELCRGFVDMTGPDLR